MYIYYTYCATTFDHIDRASTLGKPSTVNIVRYPHPDCWRVWWRHRRSGCWLIRWRLRHSGCWRVWWRHLHIWRKCGHHIWHGPSDIFLSRPIRRVFFCDVPLCFSVLSASLSVGDRVRVFFGSPCSPQIVGRC